MAVAQINVGKGNATGVVQRWFAKYPDLAIGIGAVATFDVCCIEHQHVGCHRRIEGQPE